MSDMGPNETETSGGGPVDLRSYHPQIPNAKNSIKCEVTPKGEICLLPADALGAYFLNHFGHSGEIRPVWTCQGAMARAEGPGSMYGELLSLTLRHEKPALLTDKGDPYFTGLTISQEEQQACRALVDRMRKKKRKAP